MDALEVGDTVMGVLGTQGTILDVKDRYAVVLFIDGSKGNVPFNLLTKVSDR